MGMDSESHKIDEMLELTKENNKLLRTMRRSQRMTSLFTYLYWALILGSVFGFYYYFQPTIQQYKKVFQSSVNILQNFEGKAGSIPTDMQTVKNLLGR